MNQKLVWASVLLAATAFAVAYQIPTVSATDAPSIASPTLGSQMYVASLVGADHTCTCQGAGRVAECTGDHCSCDYDWQGYPRCESGALASLT